jgi:hypothetical protein
MQPARHIRTWSIVFLGAAAVAPASLLDAQAGNSSAVVRQSAAQTPRPRKPVSPRDSLWTLRTAQNRLQVFNERVRLYAEQESNTWPIDFYCENMLPPFCYGPANGGVEAGHADGIGLPLFFRTAPGVVEKRVEKTLAAYYRYLMNELQKAYVKIPGDRWLVGQRIFHTVDNGQLERGQEMARDCVSDKWWCAALVGFTSYLLNQMPRADSAFTVALASMPADERCKWEDVSDLLYEDSGRSSYLQLSCNERSTVNKTFWWLSDPLYVTPGNERMAAHYFREVFRQLQRTSVDAMPPMLRSTIFPAPTRSGPGTPSAAIYGMELWIQGAVPYVFRTLGIPDNVVQYRRIAGDDSPLRMLLQYKQPTYAFIPDYSAVTQPLRALPNAWNIENPRAVERMHWTDGKFRTLEYQMAFFQRGSLARVIAAANVSGDTALSRSGPQLLSSSLVMTTGPQDVRVMRDTVPGSNVIFDSMIQPDSALFSIEVVASGLGAGRARFADGPAAMPRQRVTISDVMLVRSGGSPPVSLEDAIPMIQPTDKVWTAQPLGMFWEVYGLQAGDSVSYSLSTVETSTGLITRLARLVGINTREEITGVRWNEVIASGAAITPRAVELDVSQLQSGSYRLTMEIQVPGLQPVRAHRDIVVR